MSTQYRSLAPATSPNRIQKKKLLIPEDRLPRKVGGACEGCREHKRKCNRERPACQQCSRREIECIYAPFPRQTRVAALEAKSTRMESDLNSMMELYWYIRTHSKEDATTVLEAIQSGLEPDAILNNLRVSQESSPSQDTPQNSPSLVEPSQASSSTLADGSPAAQDLLEPSDFIAALEYGVEAFFNCTSCIFHIYDREEAHELLNVVRGCIKDVHQAWPKLIFLPSVSFQQKASLCSVCSMATLGLQYMKNPIPAMGFVPSIRNGTFQYVSIFYEMTKHLLEATIENDVLEAIKVCAALCVFNTISHATVALAYADMGLGFAINLGPGFQHCRPRMSEASWTNYKRVTRTLVTCRDWLVTSLGYVYGDNPGLQIAIDRLVDREGLNPTEVIQQELVKVMHIEANLLRTMDSFKNLSPLVFSATRKDLVQWHQQLPHWMHLDALMKPNQLPFGINRTVFLVHLFYLAANILVARLAHSGASSAPPQYNIEGITAASDGVIAARTASRILRLQLREQTIFQKCWLCISTSYMSILVLMHSSAQLIIHNYPQRVWQTELSHAKSCIDALEYCAQVDQVAQGFTNMIRGYYQVFTAQAEHGGDLSISDMPDTFDYLFTIPDSSPPNMSQVSREMLQLISCPFGQPSNLHIEGMLKSGFGSQLDWNMFVTLPFNQSTPVAAPKTPLEMALSKIQSGQFVGSSAPHGWNALINPNNL